MYFLLVYDRDAGRLRTLESFEDDQRDQALARRFEGEASARGNDAIEVVLLVSDSEATLRRTHGRYFKTVPELATQADPRSDE